MMLWRYQFLKTLLDYGKGPYMITSNKQNNLIFEDKYIIDFSQLNYEIDVYNFDSLTGVRCKFSHFPTPFLIKLKRVVEIMEM
jgi:hypothetical protein